MKRMMNKILTIPVCLILILIFMLPATAVSDSSITVILKNDDKAVENVEFKIYYVAAITDSSDYMLVEDFKNSGINLNEYNQKNSYDYADKFKSYAENNNISPVYERSTDINGQAVFTNIKNGVYLVIGEDFSNGKVNPFLIELPSRDENGKLIYNVTAMPKSEIINPEDKTEHHTTAEVETTSTDKEKDNNKEKLPRTGQLWWPVFPMLAVGLLLIIFGVVCRRSEDNEEKE